MLINLSNHPALKWSEAQTIAAKKQFGDIYDLPFPQINPKYSSVEVSNLAEEYVGKIQDISYNDTMNRAQTDDGVFSSNNLTVHVMGELTFCFAVVQKLKSLNINCVASTTMRNVIEEKNGQKTVLFEFVKFRNY